MDVAKLFTISTELKFWLNGGAYTLRVLEATTLDLNIVDGKGNASDGRQLKIGGNGYIGTVDDIVLWNEAWNEHDVDLLNAHYNGVLITVRDALPYEDKDTTQFTFDLTLNDFATEYENGDEVKASFDDVVWDKDRNDNADKALLFGKDTSATVPITTINATQFSISWWFKKATIDDEADENNALGLSIGDTKLKPFTDKNNCDYNVIKTYFNEHIFGLRDNVKFKCGEWVWLVLQRYEDTLYLYFNTNLNK